MVIWISPKSQQLLARETQPHERKTVSWDLQIGSRERTETRLNYTQGTRGNIWQTKYHNNAYLKNSKVNEEGNILNEHTKAHELINGSFNPWRQTHCKGTELRWEGTILISMEGYRLFKLNTSDLTKEGLELKTSLEP